MKRLVLIAMLMPLAGCADLVTRGAPAASGIPVGAGYRGADDPCRRVGRSSATAPYIARDEDLVGCPAGYDGRPAFEVATGAREVTRTGDWVIYRVPLLGQPPV